MSIIIFSAFSLSLFSPLSLFSFIIFSLSFFSFISFLFSLSLPFPVSRPPHPSFALPPSEWTSRDPCVACSRTAVTQVAPVSSLHPLPFPASSALHCSSDPMLLSSWVVGCRYRRSICRLEAKISNPFLHCSCVPLYFDPSF